MERDMKRWFVFFGTIFICFFTLELSGYFLLKDLDKKDPLAEIFENRFTRLKKLLAKEKGALPRYISAVNLNYMPTPGYTLYGVEQHNRDGYRGEYVPLEKGNKLRILFLGGSTTYGSVVKMPYQTYPAQTGAILDSLLKNNENSKGNKYTGVEVINAGMEGDYACDELNLYIHKFRYYKPDIVVWHTCGNDAEIDYNESNYSPDMVNIRSPEMYQAYRYMVPSVFYKSWFFSYVAIRFFLWEAFNHDQPKMMSSLPIYTPWYSEKISKTQGGFKPTVSIGLNVMKEDSVRVVLLPFPVNMNHPTAYDRPLYLENLKDYNTWLYEQSKKENVTWCNYQYTDIDSAHWVDDCHLWAAGEKQKASLVAKCIYGML
jgi:hypothetical protein